MDTDRHRIINYWWYKRPIYNRQAVMNISLSIGKDLDMCVSVSVVAINHMNTRDDFTTDDQKPEYVRGNKRAGECHRRYLRPAGTEILNSSVTNYIRSATDDKNGLRSNFLIEASAYRSAVGPYQWLSDTGSCRSNGTQSEMTRSGWERCT